MSNEALLMLRVKCDYLCGDFAGTDIHWVGSSNRRSLALPRFGGDYVLTLAAIPGSNVLDGFVPSFLSRPITVAFVPAVPTVDIAVTA